MCVMFERIEMWIASHDFGNVLWLFSNFNCCCGFMQIDLKAFENMTDSIANDQ